MRLDLVGCSRQQRQWQHLDGDVSGFQPYASSFSRLLMGMGCVFEAFQCHRQRLMAGKNCTPVKWGTLVAFENSHGLKVCLGCHKVAENVCVFFRRLIRQLWRWTQREERGWWRPVTPWCSLSAFVSFSTTSSSAHQTTSSLSSSASPCWSSSFPTPYHSSTTGKS